MREKLEVKKTWKIVCLAFFITAGLFVVIQAASGLYPFGNKTNLLWDEEIQYVDFFAFYRDVLLGKAELGYSFSKSLGGSVVALFGYYLGSPLNLFVVFFEKSQIPLFIFLLTTVKIGLCGGAAVFYFKKRFPGLSSEAGLMLSAAYGLMQYNIRQSSNIMWLDGVIFLPLLLLAVYNYTEKKKKLPLFFMVLVSIAVNWYTGYMTGLFAVCYFFYERILKVSRFSLKECKEIFRDTAVCGLTMFLGLLGSCFMFYPVAKGLQKGKDVLDWSIFQYQTYGSFLDTFQGFAVGGLFSTVSLYCGILFFGFFLYYFICKNVNFREKLLSFLAAGFMFASCWLVPLDCIWSGLRAVQSFPFRYSFVVVFLVLYLAARGWAEYEKKREPLKMACIFLLCGGLFLFFRLKERYSDVTWRWTIAAVVLYGLVFLCLRQGRALKTALWVLLMGELLLNGAISFKANYGNSGEIAAYQEYVVQEERLVQEVKEREDSKFYRMDTLEKRNVDGTGTSAYLNEPMAYGYRGLSHYSSAYDSDVIKLLYDMGYTTEFLLGGTEESILPADSLLGIKYLFSAREVLGYVKEEGIQPENGKSVYYNPYALGVGMGASEKVFQQIDTLDPFEYQNRLFSQILGRETELFKRVEPVMQIADNTASFWFPGREAGGILYGYVDSWVQDLQLFIDGEYRCNYATWLGYRVFSAGVGEKEHLVVLTNFTGTDQEIFPYFYYLDQEIFEQVVAELRDREMKVDTFQDGFIEGHYETEEAGQLLLTVPYNEGWKAWVNGKETEIKRGANALTVISVEKGTNKIQLKYQVPGAKTGFLLSVAAIAGMGGLLFWEKKRLSPLS